jgi:hypothetical protein
VYRGGHRKRSEIRLECTQCTLGDELLERVFGQIYINRSAPADAKDDIILIITHQGTPNPTMTYRVHEPYSNSIEARRAGPSAPPDRLHPRRRCSCHRRLPPGHRYYSHQTRLQPFNSAPAQLGDDGRNILNTISCYYDWYDYDIVVCSTSDEGAICRMTLHKGAKARVILQAVT